MSRLFVDTKQIRGDRIFITGADARYIAKVLRKRKGDSLLLVGPDGVEYLARIENIGAADTAGIETRILERLQPDREPHTKVVIAQALIKGDKLEWVIQKGTELGAQAFIPFAARRSVVRWDEARAQNRVDRWQRIAESAAQQSGRLHIPPVSPVQTMEQLVETVRDFVDRWGVGSVILAWEGETEHSLFQALSARLGLPGPDGGRKEDNLLVIIGPEGGFEAGEVAMLTAAGAVAVSLGKLILRTETVGVAVLSMILYHAGDLGRIKNS